MNNRVKITTFERILELIYPSYCRGCGKVGESFCSRCIFDNIRQNRPIISASDKEFYRILACGMREGVLSRLISEYKFQARRHFSQALSEYIYAVFVRYLQGCDDNFVLVPLPTVRKHIRERGFDHIERLVRDFSLVSGLPVIHALSRRKNTVQVGSDAKTRLEQAKGAYMINSKVVLSDKCHYILVDDVWTTGATMRAARAILAAEIARLGLSDTKISAIVLAKNSGWEF